MRVLITNSVPLNGGDEALLRATVESLAARWPGAEITVLCSAAAECRDRLPDLRIAPDLEHAEGGTRGPLRRAAGWAADRLRRARGTGGISAFLDRLASPDERRRVLELYRDADVVLSAPGGFFHDHYPIEARLKGLEVALSMGKPVILFGQSVGPFWKPESLARVPRVFNRVSAVCVRDAVSRTRLAACGVDPSRIRETADAAFLWRRLAPELFVPKRGPVGRIALCFRAWPLGDEAATGKTVEKAGILCRHLLAEPGREIVFLSTCQGIPGYVDDSLLALRVVASLPESARSRCRVDRLRYPPRQLIGQLAACDAFIGMRLHAAILAMLGGTPAMGLGYESKTEEIFRQMGFEAYQVGFENDAAAWLRCADRFLSDVDACRQALPDRLDRLCARAALNLDAVSECVGRA